MSIRIYQLYYVNFVIMFHLTDYVWIIHVDCTVSLNRICISALICFIYRFSKWYSSDLHWCGENSQAITTVSICYYLLSNFVFPYLTNICHV
jgi:hypothetical protein